jgi:hypothetical protein
MSDNTASEKRLAELEAMVASLQARVQELEDDRAIRDTLSEYGFHADNCDDDAFVELYTEDGAIKVSASAKAREAFGDKEWVEWLDKDGVRQFITHPQGHHRPELYGKSMHLQGNNLVTQINGEEAVANSYQVAIVVEDGRPRVLSAGNNRWELRKVSGKWLIKERRGAYLGDGHFASNLEPVPASAPPAQSAAKRSPSKSTNARKK